MLEKIVDILVWFTAVILVSFVLAVPIYFLWNNIYMAFNCNQITYFQAVMLMVLINFIKPVSFEKPAKNKKTEYKKNE